MGLPTRETAERAQRGEVILGGCIVSGFEPKYYLVGSSGQSLSQSGDYTNNSGDACSFSLSPETMLATPKMKSA